MKRYPSIKTLEPVFGGRAAEARALMRMDKGHSTYAYQSVRDLVAQCYTKPRYHERLMCALDEIAGTSGVEALMGRDEQWPDYEYLNAGDTYTTTLIYSYATHTFRVSDWGSIVERAGNRYA